MSQGEPRRGTQTPPLPSDVAKTGDFERITNRAKEQEETDRTPLRTEHLANLTGIGKPKEPPKPEKVISEQALKSSSVEVQTARAKKHAEDLYNEIQKYE